MEGHLVSIARRGVRGNTLRWVSRSCSRAAGKSTARSASRAGCPDGTPIVVCALTRDGVQVTTKTSMSTSVGQELNECPEEEDDDGTYKVVATDQPPCSTDKVVHTWPFFFRMGSKLSNLLQLWQRAQLCTHKQTCLLLRGPSPRAASTNGLWSAGATARKRRHG